jgi:hypothetical protein
MNDKMFTYVAYLLLSGVLTYWVGRSLYRNGKVFLASVFDGDVNLAGSVNRLLVVGFYLVNLGFISLMLRTRQAAPTATGTVELLSRKLGLVLLLLGVLHLGNLLVLNWIRRRQLTGAALRTSPPPAPGDQGRGDAARPAGGTAGQPARDPARPAEARTRVVAAEPVSPTGPVPPTGKPVPHLGEPVPSAGETARVHRAEVQASAYADAAFAAAPPVPLR